MRISLIAGAVIASAILLASASFAASPAKGDAKKGAAIFASNCASCHGAHGEGGVGPKLQKTKLTVAQVVKQVKNPAPPMPKLYPTPLSDQDVANVSAFVKTL